MLLGLAGAGPASFSGPQSCCFARSLCGGSRPCHRHTYAQPNAAPAAAAVCARAALCRAYKQQAGTPTAESDAGTQPPATPETLQAQQPARSTLGSLLLQQPKEPQRPSLGPVLLHQAPLPAPCSSLAQQQRPRQPQMQLCQRSLHVMQPEASAAAGGVPVRRLERYTCQEAADFKGTSWPPSNGTATSVGDFPPSAAAAAGAAAALVHEWSTLSRTHNSPRLVVAAKSVLLEPPAAVEEATAMQQLQNAGQATARRRRRTSTTTSGTGSRNCSSSSPQQDSTSSSQHDSSNSSSSSSRQHDSSGSSSSNSSSRKSSSSQQHDSSHSSSPHAAAVEALPDAEQLSDKDVLLQLHEALQQQHGIQLEQHFGQHRLLCPRCLGGSQQEQSLSVSLPADQPGTAVWCCHRATCAWTGRFQLPLPSGRQRRTAAGGSGNSRGSVADSVTQQQEQQQQQPVPVPAAAASQLQPLTAELLSYLQVQRCISPTVLLRNRVKAAPHSTAANASSSGSGSSGSSVIAFPYYQDGVLVNIKYRSLNKRFHQVKGGQQVFYGINDLQGASEAIIVEGELDKLALETATGLTAVLSLPSGALPAAAGARTRRDSKKLACVDAAAQQLVQLQRIIVAVDGDEPGLSTALALHEKLLALAQRHAVQQQQQQGAAAAAAQQVLYLAWPTAKLGGQEALRKAAAAAAAAGLHVDLSAAARCKDANDLLVCCGADFLKLYLQVAPVAMSS